MSDTRTELTSRKEEVKMTEKNHDEICSIEKHSIDDPLYYYVRPFYDVGQEYESGDQYWRTGTELFFDYNSSRFIMKTIEYNSSDEVYDFVSPEKFSSYAEIPEDVSSYLNGDNSLSEHSKQCKLSVGDAFKNMYTYFYHRNCREVQDIKNVKDISGNGTEFEISVRCSYTMYQAFCLFEQNLGIKNNFLPDIPNSEVKFRLVASGDDVRVSNGNCVSNLLRHVQFNDIDYPTCKNFELFVSDSADSLKDSFAISPLYLKEFTQFLAESAMTFVLDHDKHFADLNLFFHYNIIKSFNHAFDFIDGLAKEGLVRYTDPTKTVICPVGDFKIDDSGNELYSVHDCALDIASCEYRDTTSDLVWNAALKGIYMAKDGKALQGEPVFEYMKNTSVMKNFPADCLAMETLHDETISLKYDSATKLFYRESDIGEKGYVDDIAKEDADLMKVFRACVLREINQAYRDSDKPYGFVVSESVFQAIKEGSFENLKKTLDKNCSPKEQESSK